MREKYTGSNNDEAWQDKGACLGLAGAGKLFFSENNGDINRAKEICNTACPVQEDCLEWALAERIVDGVLGGTSARERKKILKIRRQSKQNPS